MSEKPADSPPGVGTLPPHSAQSVGWMRPWEALGLAVVLVAAHHTIPYTFFYHVVYRAGWRSLYDLFGEGNFATLYDAAYGVFPFLLCLTAPGRSGLRLGKWRGHTWKVVGICIAPAVLVAVTNPLTSRPFIGERIGCWLVSPATQDLLFSGYLYGFMAAAIPGRISRYLPLPWSMLIIAMLFSAWHTLNFLCFTATFVAFQLFYTFLFGLWFLIPRRLTGSILPGILTHTACNFIGWMGW